MEKSEKNKTEEKRNLNVPHEVQTWQEHVADEVLSIAVAIQQHGADKHDVSVGIDAAVQAAGMAYCSKRAHEHRLKELKRGKPGPGEDGDLAIPWSDYYSDEGSSGLATTRKRPHPVRE